MFHVKTNHINNKNPESSTKIITGLLLRWWIYRLPINVRKPESRHCLTHYFPEDCLQPCISSVWKWCFYLLPLMGCLRLEIQKIASDDVTQYIKRSSFDLMFPIIFILRTRRRQKCYSILFLFTEKTCLTTMTEEQVPFGVCWMSNEEINKSNYIYTRYF